MNSWLTVHSLLFNRMTRDFLCDVEVNDGERHFPLFCSSCFVSPFVSLMAPSTANRVPLDSLFLRSNKQRIFSPLTKFSAVQRETFTPCSLNMVTKEHLRFDKGIITLITATPHWPSTWVADTESQWHSSISSFSQTHSTQWTRHLYQIDGDNFLPYVLLFTAIRSYRYIGKRGENGWKESQEHYR